MNYIDLFAGAGGLSEGFLQNGFSPLAHVEMNEDACFTLKTRLCYHYLKDNNKLRYYNKYLQGKITREELYSLVPQELLESVINEKMSDETIRKVFEKVDNLIGEKSVDVIIGGPPCQAYSLVGRAVKGLEFKEVFVFDSNMTNNEKYIAYTRALVKLNVIKDLPTLTDRNESHIMQGIEDENIEE